ncbi:MAG: nuclear transport factor 2 family protein [Halieaceae bacterium]|nr:nuclear transport factor 2 family protein [Halieaceae bacterium]
MAVKNENKLAIRELMSRAACGLDMRDVDMLAACFTEDADFTMRIAGGDLIGPFEGREGIMELMTNSMAENTDQRRHIISNLFFEREGDESAVVVSYLTLTVIENGEIRLITTAVYRDTVARVGEDWQLQHRHIDLDLPY